MIRRRRLTGQSVSTAEVVEHDVFGFDPQIEEHVDAGLIHHGRPAHVVLAVLRRRVVFEVVVVKDLVNEARVSLPVVFRDWVTEREMPLEVGVFFLNPVEVIDVEGFLVCKRLNWSKM